MASIELAVGAPEVPFDTAEFLAAVVSIFINESFIFNPIKARGFLTEQEASHYAPVLAISLISSQATRIKVRMHAIPAGFPV